MSYGKAQCFKKVHGVVRVSSNSRADAIGQLSGSRAGFKLTVVQSQGDKLLKTGVDLLVHGRVLGSDGGQLLKQAGSATVVVALRILESLSMLGSVGFHRVALGRSGFGAFHGRCTAYRLGDRLPLTHAGAVLFLGSSWATGSCGLWRAWLILSSVVMNPLHVVKKVPPTGKTKSRNGSVASVKQT